MRGSLVRFQLFLKRWFTSLTPMILMLLIPVMAYVIYSSGSSTVEDFASLVYEEAVPIWFVLILQWCLSVDFDSKFYTQVMTYPIARWKFLVERLVVASVIFIGLFSIMTGILSSFIGSFAWLSFLFTLPIHLIIAGLVVAGTVLVNHSVGGLLAGLLFWMLYEFGGVLLGDLNVILIKYGSVYTFVKGETGFWVATNHWILYNRLFYLGIGVLFIGLAMWKFNRNTA